MDHTHIGGGMSPLYVPRKRKHGQSQQKSGVPCPVVQRLPERACELSVIGQPKNDGSRAQDAIKMKRTYGRKRYEDLQSVSIGTVEFPTTSCSVMAERLPARLVGKDMWPQGQEPSRERSQPAQEPSWNTNRDRGSEQAWSTGRDRPQDPAWNSGRDRAGHSGQEQAWMPDRTHRTHGGADQASWVAGRDRAPEQAWATGRDRAQDQAWNPGRDPGRDRASSSAGPEQVWNTSRSQDQAWSTTSRGQDPVWRPPDLATTKKVQRVEMDRNPPVITFPQAPGGRDSGSDPGNIEGLQGTTEASTAQPSEELRTPLFSTKKEPPTYPPGSQEERWQLLIVAKGWVNCPKCKSVSRKTVDGLKKHMENCRLQLFTCQHCGKQLKSSTGMKYHIMADHSHLPSPDDALNDKQVKEKLRKILKRLGKLKCSKEGCSAGFTSIMGYVYHMKKCGKAQSELEKLVLNCTHCGKAYKSKAGLEYHRKTEHAPSPQPKEEEDALKTEMDVSPERTASGRLQRASAQVANFHLAEIANNELPKDWPKRKFHSDLVPDDKKLMFSRPSLPAFSQEVLRKWKNEVKLQRKVQCPNQGCGCIYTSVSGLKAHLGLCTKGDFEAGKYRCLICNKEFNSESGVKYHIHSVHSQEWFATNKKACKKFEKFFKDQPKEYIHGVDRQIIEQYHQHHLHHHHLQQHHHHHQHLQHQAIQQPLQPLHHLQHQVQVHHPENYHPQQQQQHHPAPLTDPQLQPQLLLYTVLEPPVGSK